MADPIAPSPMTETLGCAQCSFMGGVLLAACGRPLPRGRFWSEGATDFGLFCGAQFAPGASVRVKDA